MFCTIEKTTLARWQTQVSVWMATCKVCEKSGWFLSLDTNGMCRNCASVHLPQIVRHCDIVIHSIILVGKSKNAKTKLSRAQVAMQHCRELLPFEARGVPTLTSSPKAVMADLAAIINEIVETQIQEQIYTARRKSLDAHTPTGKLGAYAKAIEVLDGLTGELKDVTKVEAAIVSLREERDAVAFGLLEKKGEAALAKGNVKGAIQAHIDALLSLKNDSTPTHLQRHMAVRARAKIIELGGTPPALE
jgi:hypothetical protein